MVVVGQTIAFAISVAGLVTLVRLSRSGPPAAPLPLAAFPFALLLLIAPVPLAALQSIRDFQEVGASGSAGARETAELARAIVWPLWIGCFGFVAVLAASAVIQSFREPDTEPSPVPPPEQRPRRRWIGWVLCAFALLTIPAGILVSLTREIGAWLLQAGVALTAPNVRPVIAGMDLEQFSQAVSGRLILGTLAGSALAIVVLFLGVANVFTHRMSTTSPALDRVSWGVMAIAGAFGIWTLIALTMSVRSAAV